MRFPKRKKTFFSTIKKMDESLLERICNALSKWGRITAIFESDITLEIFMEATELLFKPGRRNSYDEIDVPRMTVEKDIESPFHFSSIRRGRNVSNDVSAEAFSLSFCYFTMYNKIELHQWSPEDNKLFYWLRKIEEEHEYPQFPFAIFPENYEPRKNYESFMKELEESDGYIERDIPGMFTVKPALRDSENERGKRKRVPEARRDSKKLKKDPCSSHK